MTYARNLADRASLTGVDAVLTLDAAVTQRMPALTTCLIVGGRSAHGDWGDPVPYRLVESEPSHAAKFSTNGGTVWWEFAGTRMSPQHTGATLSQTLNNAAANLGLPDSTAACLAWPVAMEAVGATGFVPHGYIRCERTIPVFEGMRVTGAPGCTLVRTIIETVDTVAAAGGWAEAYPMFYGQDRDDVHFSGFDILLDDQTGTFGYMADEGEHTWPFPHASGDELFVYYDGQDQIFELSGDPDAGTVSLRTSLPSQEPIGTITLPGGVDIGTDVLTTGAAHGLTTGDAISFSDREWDEAGLPVITGVSMPGRLRASKVYFARVLSATTLSVHYARQDAISNINRLDITSGGAAYIYLRAAPLRPVTGILAVTAAATAVDTPNNTIPFASADWFATTRVALKSSDTMPGGLSSALGVTYYVRPTADGYAFYADPDDALNDQNRIEITSQGAGTITMRRDSMIQVCRFTGFSNPGPNRHAAILLDRCDGPVVDGVRTFGHWYNGVNLQNCSRWRLSNSKAFGALNRPFYIYSPEDAAQNRADFGHLDNNLIDGRCPRTGEKVSSYGYALNATGPSQALVSLVANGNICVHTISFAWSLTGRTRGVTISNSTIGHVGSRGFYVLANVTNERSDDVIIQGFNIYGMGHTGIGVYNAGCERLNASNGIVQQCLSAVYSFNATATDEPDALPSNSIMSNITAMDTYGEGFYFDYCDGLSITNLKSIRPRGRGFRFRRGTGAIGSVLSVVDPMGADAFLFADMLQPNFSGLSTRGAFTGTGLRLTQSGSDPVDWMGQFTNLSLRGSTTGLNIGAWAQGNVFEGATDLVLYSVNANSAANTLNLRNRLLRQAVTGGSGATTWGASLHLAVTARMLDYTATFTGHRDLTLSRTSITEGMEVLVRRAVAAGVDAFVVNLTDATGPTVIGTVAAGEWARVAFIDGEWRTIGKGEL